MLLRVLIAFLIKKQAEFHRYWSDFIVGLFIKFIFFLGALYAKPIQNLDEAITRISAFSLWYLSAHVVSKLANSPLEEAYLGTLEQVLSMRARKWHLLFGLIVSEIFSRLFESLCLLGCPLSSSEV